MKKNELLYCAIGDINDKTAADAYESGGENSGRGQRVRTILSVAAAVLAVAGLFVFSMFLLTYTVWNKNTDKGPATGKAEDTADNMQIIFGNHEHMMLKVLKDSAMRDNKWWKSKRGSTLRLP